MFSKIKTSCQNCIFAKYQNKTQIGCELGRIYKFARRNTDIVKCYNEESEFFLINGKLCIAYRNIIWQNKHTGKDLIEQVKKEIALNYTLFISHNGGEFEKIIQSINNLDIPPVKLVVLNRTDKRHSIDMLKRCKTKWDEVGIINKELSDFSHLNDMILSNRVKSMFWFLRPEEKLDKLNDFINKIEYLVNEELHQLECLKDDEGKTIGGMVLLNKLYSEYFEDYIKDKDNIITITGV